jgi:hypothetical protein
MTKVFISYSHKDAKWLERLQIHLKPLEYEGLIERWDDTRIKPGTQWREAIEKALAETKVAVLLVSADFLASDFITTDELPRLLATAKSGGTTILPVILSASRFEKTPSLAQFQAVNPPSQPLNSLSIAEQEAVWVKVAEAVEQTLQMVGGISPRPSGTHHLTPSFPSAPSVPDRPVEPIKILFLAANPTGTGLLALDKEAREVETKIRAAEYRDALVLLTKWAVRPDDLLQSFNQHRPEIVHFSGHGSTAEELILVNDQDQPQAVSKAALSALFRTLKDNIRVVVLNACFSKPQAEAITEYIECTIGMNSAIGNTAAITFAASFYRALGFGRSVQEAFDQGKAALLLEGIPEENTPVLLARPGVNPSQVRFFPPPGSTPRPP